MERRRNAFALLCLLASSAVSAAVLRPGTIALAFVDGSAKAERSPDRGPLVIASMRSAFLRMSVLEVLPQEGSDSAQRSLRLFRQMDPKSLPDAIDLGKKVGAEAVAVAALSVIDAKAGLTIRLYETAASRMVAESSISSAPDRLVEFMDACIAKLCAAWAARTAVDPSAPAPAATAAVPRYKLGALAGYGSVASMNCELEATLPGQPFAAGIELAYERVDLIAVPDDVLSISLVGRYWPFDLAKRSGFFLSLGAGLSVDVLYGAEAGPLRFAAGWTFRIPSGEKAFSLALPLRIQPEAGFSWSMRPRWQDTTIIGLLPYVGVKFGM